ncbi:tyrosine-type recombinase/integrase [Priestia sp. D51]
MFNDDEKEKLKRAFSNQPKYKTSTGFTGNKKSKKEKDNFVVGKKRRKTNHLTNKERKQLMALHQQVDELFVANSHIEAKSEDKLTKKDFKKGDNNNLGAYGIHGSVTFEKYKSIAKTFVKETFEKNKNLGHISEIGVGEYMDWMEDKMKNGQPNGEKYSGKTIGLYGSAIKKMAESAEVHGGEYQRLESLGTEKVTRKLDKMKDQYSARYTKEQYKRGKSYINKDGKQVNGYSYKDAQKLVKKANDISPYHGAMYEVLSQGCPRHDELLRIKWRQVDTENHRIYLDDPNQTKGGRPRFIPISEKTSQKLQSIMDSGHVKNKDTRIWGSRMTKDDVYNLTKHLCREAHVGYSGVHDFRRAAVEFHMKGVEKAFRSGKLTRDELENKFLDHVNSHPQLNPVGDKWEKVRDDQGKVMYEPMTDKRGNPRKDKNGKTRMQAMWRPKMDENNKVVRGPRYTKEDLAEWRTDKLINSYISQVLGHNRSDATSPYKNK